MPITTSVATSCATTPGLATQVLHRGGFKRKRAPYTGALGKGGTYAGWHRRFSPPCVKGACRRSRLGDCFPTTPPSQQVTPPPQGLLRSPRTGEALGKGGTYAGWHSRFRPPCVKGACRRSRLGDCFLTTPPLQQVAPPPQGLLRNPRTGEALGKRGSVIQGNLVKKEVSLYRWPSLVRFIFPWCFICIY